MTIGELAEALAPVATDEVLAPYRDPALAAQPAAAGLPVALDAVAINRVDGDTAVVTGRGVRADGATVWRTLRLSRVGGGAWKVSGIE